MPFRKLESALVFFSSLAIADCFQAVGLVGGLRVSSSLLSSTSLPVASSVANIDDPFGSFGSGCNGSGLATAEAGDILAEVKQHTSLGESDFRYDRAKCTQLLSGRCPMPKLR